MAVIAVGIDAVSVERVRRATAATPRGERFRARVFTAAERRVCDCRRDPAESYAARFAAKEAVMKALGAEGISFAWRDIEVVRDACGAPSIAVHGRVAMRCDELGVRVIHVSLTHAEPLALASVVLES
ncbi:MAG: holo-ACP synthase [Deltaproteobacteria bacterium]|nr:holo-ACP synthase [Deltaproteobacteria bacterium]